MASLWEGLPGGILAPGCSAPACACVTPLKVPLADPLLLDFGTCKGNSPAASNPSPPSGSPFVSGENAASASAPGLCAYCVVRGCRVDSTSDIGDAKQVTHVIALPQGATPVGVAVNTTGTMAVVAESGRGMAAILNLSTYSVAGLQQWWAQASQVWEDNRASERLSLTEQLDFQSKLSKQLPVAPFRVVYNKSGMHICSAKLRNPRALCTHGLYWAPANSEDEADYLCAILNAPTTTELTRPLMSYGKDERDIHKEIG